MSCEKCHPLCHYVSYKLGISRMLIFRSLGCFKRVLSSGFSCTVKTLTFAVNVLCTEKVVSGAW